MPRTFQEKYPIQMRNLRLNSRKLTTPFDIHETLKDILNFDEKASSKLHNEKTFESTSETPRGISLFRHIPINRTCEDAQIEAHWCACLNWIDVSILLNKSSNEPPSNIYANANSSSNTTKAAANNAQEEFASIVEQISAEDFYNNIKTMDISNNSSQTINVSSIIILNNQTTENNEQLKSNRVNYDQYKSIEQALSRYTKASLLLANKAVNFINSLIDNDYKKYCEIIRLRSIEKLSKLQLSAKLLAFKESKDIHGREAVFDDTLYKLFDADANKQALDETDVDALALANMRNFQNGTVNIAMHNESRLNLTIDTNYTSDTNLNKIIGSINNISEKSETNESFKRMKHSSLNSFNNVSKILLNYDVVYQIVLTTWPGDAIYELSFKYNKYFGLFKFNKEEISRINSYNGTSNCMLNRRPDLRQFCYCKYV
jgi:hypothetical protein